jgi:hypothetical protein
MRRADFYSEMPRRENARLARFLIQLSFFCAPHLNALSSPQIAREDPPSKPSTSKPTARKYVKRSNECNANWLSPAVKKFFS